MRHYVSYLLFLSFLAIPNFVSAQLFQPLTGVVPVSTSSQQVVSGGFVDLVVEARTYKPAFYRGRGEPSLGNIVRLVAVPLGQSPANFTYQWSAAGQALSDTGPVASFSNLFEDRVRVSVNVIDQNGALFARAEEVVQISKPQVVFYEENILRGHGSRAIRDTHTLIGEEGVIRAEPFFVGLGASPQSYRSTWKLNGTEVNSGGDWRELLLQRPDTPLSNYRIEFSANNENNLAEGVQGGFNLNFGL
jgi:hypothetical protein